VSDFRPEFRIPLSKRRDKRDRTYYIAHLNFPAMLITQGMTAFVMTECSHPVLVFRPTSPSGPSRAEPTESGAVLPEPAKDEAPESEE